MTLLIFRPTPLHPTHQIKHFQGLKKAISPLGKKKNQYSFPTPIKWKEYSIGPLIRGIKTQYLQKRSKLSAISNSRQD